MQSYVIIFGNFTRVYEGLYWLLLRVSFLFAFTELLYFYDLYFPSQIYNFSSLIGNADSIKSEEILIGAAFFWEIVITVSAILDVDHYKICIRYVHNVVESSVGWKTIFFVWQNDLVLTDKNFLSSLKFINIFAVYVVTMKVHGSCSIKMKDIHCVVTVL